MGGEGPVLLLRQVGEAGRDGESEEGGDERGEGEGDAEGTRSVEGVEEVDSPPLRSLLGLQGDACRASRSASLLGMEGEERARAASISAAGR